MFRKSDKGDFFSAVQQILGGFVGVCVYQVQFAEKGLDTTPTLAPLNILVSFFLPCLEL